MAYSISKEEAQLLLEKILKQNGYSVTKTRKIVFDALWGQDPQTMREIYGKTIDKIDRSSLYRTSELFQQLGLVERLAIGWKYKLELSDAFVHHHHHISCLGCDTVKVIDEHQQIEQLIHAIAQKYDISPDRHQFEIQGYCKNCRAKNQRHA